MKQYLSNAFSLNMININKTVNIKCIPINPVIIPQDVLSGIGHIDTANILTGLLGFKVACNRITLQLTDDDVLYVAQYSGPRLQEGATSLPDNAAMQYFMITFNYA